MLGFLRKRREQRRITAANFEEAEQKAEQQIGHIAVAGRYHHLPKRLEDDFEVSSQVLGTGLNGSVVKATCRYTGTTFAVKHLQKASMSPEQQKILANEVQLCLEMDHPHIARLVHVYEAKSQVSLVMECMTGGELFDRCTEKKSICRA